MHHAQHQDTTMEVTEAFDPPKAKRFRRNPSPENTKTRNVVIFGDSGVGKSSLINMLAGQRTAETSHGALGCTFETRRYTIAINGEPVNVWDTAGLDEGTRGRVLPEVAEKSLSNLLRELRKANGIHLLVYCMRGPGVRKSLARNYAIFYSAICRKKVPIVAVVTGLENEPVSMDNWWFKGEKQLEKFKMRFDAHACVTTIDMEMAANSVFQERSVMSQQLVQKLIVDYCHRVAIRPPSDPNVLIKSALVDFRSMIQTGWDNAQPASSVVFYQSDVPLFHSGVFGDVQQMSSQIGGHKITFHHAGDLSDRYIHHKISKGNADLLIFSGTMSDRNVEKFRRFYVRCVGEVCPLLVVTDDAYVDAWTRRIDSLGIAARVAPIPTDGQKQGELLSLVDDLCLVRAPGKFRQRKFLRFFRRPSRENTGNEVVPDS